MAATDLLTPLLDGGIRRSNFFNGRLLTAEDLRGEQAAERAGRALLGRALGAGVATGLMVAPIPGAAAGTPAVRVFAGLAVDGLGQAIALPEDAEVRLLREATALPAEAGLFSVCAPPSTAALPSGLGAYILTIAGASGFEGRAPAAGLAANALPGGACGSRWAVEGVRFRLVALPLGGIAGPVGAATDFAHRTDPPGRGILRSLIAHACLGTAELAAALAGHPAAAFMPGRELGVLATLAASGALTPCEVPLAVLLWGTDGLRLPDNWAVRRPLAGADADPAHPLASGTTARCRGLAAMLQFQDQLADDPQALQWPALGRVAALPPAGVLPPDTPWQRFLGHHAPVAATPADPAVLGAALREALELPAVHLRPIDPSTWRVPEAEPFEVLDGGPACGFVFRRARWARLRVILPTPVPGLVLEARPELGGGARRVMRFPSIPGLFWNGPNGEGYVADRLEPGVHQVVPLSTVGAGGTSGPLLLRAGHTTDFVALSPPASPPTASPPTGSPPTAPPVSTAAAGVVGKP